MLLEATARVWQSWGWNSGGLAPDSVLLVIYCPVPGIMGTIPGPSCGLDLVESCLSRESWILGQVEGVGLWLVQDGVPLALAALQGSLLMMPVCPDGDHSFCILRLHSSGRKGWRGTTQAPARPGKAAGNEGVWAGLVSRNPCSATA